MSEARVLDEQLLSVSDLVIEYRPRHRKPPFRAVDGVTFEIGRGETLGLVGESGSGKTTIARTIQGLLHPTSGAIHVNGAPVATRRLADRRGLAAVVQTVFQDPFGSLNPSRRIGSIVEIGRAHV